MGSLKGNSSTGTSFGYHAHEGPTIEHERTLLVDVNNRRNTLEPKVIELLAPATTASTAKNPIHRLTDLTCASEQARQTKTKLEHRCATIDTISEVILLEIFAFLSTGRRRTFARTAMEVAPPGAPVSDGNDKSPSLRAAWTCASSARQAQATQPIVVRYIGCRNPKPKSGHAPLQGKRRIAATTRTLRGARVRDIDIGCCGLDARKWWMRYEAEKRSFSLPSVILHSFLILVLLVKVE